MKLEVPITPRGLRSSWLTVAGTGAFVGLDGERHANQLGQALGVQFLHDAGAVDLDGPGADGQLDGHRFVGMTDDQVIEHLALARR